jgi:hypothetical protein
VIEIEIGERLHEHPSLVPVCETRWLGFAASEPQVEAANRRKPRQDGRNAASINRCDEPLGIDSTGADPEVSVMEWG